MKNLRKTDRTELKEGMVIYFKYEHNYNSCSRAIRYKRGIFLGEEKKKAVLILQGLHGNPANWNSSITRCDFDRIYIEVKNDKVDMKQALHLLAEKMQEENNHSQESINRQIASKEIALPKNMHTLATKGENVGATPTPDANIKEISLAVKEFEEGINELGKSWSWLLSPDYEKKHYRVLEDVKQLLHSGKLGEILK